MRVELKFSWLIAIRLPLILLRIEMATVSI